MTPLSLVTLGVGCLFITHGGALFAQRKKTKAQILSPLSLVLASPLVLSSLNSLCGLLFSADEARLTQDWSIVKWIGLDFEFQFKMSLLGAMWSAALLSLFLFVQAYRNLRSSRKRFGLALLSFVAWFHLSDAFSFKGEWTQTILQVSGALSIVTAMISTSAWSDQQDRSKQSSLFSRFEYLGILSALFALGAIYLLLSETQGIPLGTPQQVSIWISAILLVLMSFWRSSEVTRGVVTMSILYLVLELV
jgi:hypothetical protein